MEPALASHSLWALNSHDGLLEVVEGTLDEAWERAEKIGVATAGFYDSDSLVAYDTGEPPAHALVANPRTAAGESMKLAGLPRISLPKLLRRYPLGRPNRMFPLGHPVGGGLAEAYSRILPYMPTERVPGADDVWKWQRVETATDLDALLTTNTKMRKPPDKSDPDYHLAYGLSLIPNSMAFRYDSELGDPKTMTICSRSTPQCRAMCLEKSGQNLISRYNRAVKTAKTAALLGEPEAFCRVLLAAIAKFSGTAQGAGKVPYVRPNIYSDIPWELFFPGLFDEFFSGVQFYDYTKVPGRAPPANYHLTFSYSGTEQNRRDTEQELARGRNVAVVFDVPRGTMPRGSFWGLPIIDGDAHDIRPLDQDRVGTGQGIVGLSWKPPTEGGRGAKESARHLKGFEVFVVPCQYVDGHYVVTDVPSLKGSEWSRPPSRGLTSRGRGATSRITRERS